MNQDELIGLAKNAALDAGLDRALVCAVCEQESSWDPWATREEPGFLERYSANFKGTSENWRRSISWGLMQLLGEVAREFGYKGALAQLCDPAVGLVWGCKKLRRCLDDSGGDVHQALQRWNGGAAAGYADQVMARMVKYQ